MKKTILVIYTNEVRKEKKDDKRYCFSTDSEVKKGDLLKSQSYTTNMMVVDVVEKEFKYYSAVTGEMSNELNSTTQREIKSLRVIESIDEEVLATKLN